MFRDDNFLLQFLPHRDTRYGCDYEFQCLDDFFGGVVRIVLLCCVGEERVCGTDCGDEWVRVRGYEYVIRYVIGSDNVYIENSVPSGIEE